MIINDKWKEVNKEGLGISGCYTSIHMKRLRKTTYKIKTLNKGSSVNTVTEPWAGQLGFECQQGQEFFPLPPGPDEPWDPFNLLSTQYCKLLPQR
jgi:hypothetical protein